MSTLSTLLTTDGRDHSVLTESRSWQGAAAALVVHAAVALAIAIWPAAQPVTEPVTVVELVLERPAEPSPPPEQEITPPQPQVPVARPKVAPPRPMPSVAPLSRADGGMAPAQPVSESSSPPSVSPAPSVAAAPPPKGVEDVLAAPVSQSKPFYPRIARQRGWQGLVIVRVSVDESGMPCHAVIQGSSGHAVLDEAALDAVRGWRFSPARRDGRTIASAVDVPVRFSLGEG